MTCHLNSTIKFEIESSHTSCSRFCLLLMLLFMFSLSHYATTSFQKYKNPFYFLIPNSNSKTIKVRLHGTIRNDDF